MFAGCPRTKILRLLAQVCHLPVTCRRPEPVLSPFLTSFCVSTFTGYILRLRGYYHNRDKLPVYERGITFSWFYNRQDPFGSEENLHFVPPMNPIWGREYPTAWRLIDEDVAKNSRNGTERQALTAR
jgi:hypothetical protein